MKPNTICPSCRIGGLVILKEAALDGRPQFQCTSCDYKFTNGKDGEPYFSALVMKEVNNES